MGEYAEQKRSDPDRLDRFPKCKDCAKEELMIMKARINVMMTLMVLSSLTVGGSAYLARSSDLSQEAKIDRVAEKQIEIDTTQDFVMAEIAKIPGIMQQLPQINSDMRDIVKEIKDANEAQTKYLRLLTERDAE